MTDEQYFLRQVKKLFNTGRYTAEDVSRVTRRSIKDVLDAYNKYDRGFVGPQLIFNRSKLEDEIKNAIASSTAVGLVGPTGCGKTVLVHHVITSLGKRHETYNCGAYRKFTAIASEIGNAKFAPNTILVLDNFDDVNKQGFSDFLKTVGDDTKILVTCTAASTLSGFRSVKKINVPPLTPGEMKEMIRINYPLFDANKFDDVYSPDARVMITNIENGIKSVEKHVQGELTLMELAYRIITGKATMAEINRCKYWYWLFPTLAGNASKIWENEDLEKALDILSRFDELNYPDPEYKKSALLLLPVTRKRPSLKFIKGPKKIGEVVEEVDVTKTKKKKLKLVSHAKGRVKWRPSVDSMLNI